MADLAIYGAPDRDFEQALIALKKGTQLLKYSRKGKPKFRAFRLSPDETTLIWLSHGEEKTVKLSSVTRIIPGQRTAVFRRYLRPEKDYLSFSLIYNNGDRSLDLICKDKVEAEVWLAGLKSLIVKHRERRSRSDISDLTDTSGEYLPSSRAIANAGIDLHSGTTRGRSSIDLGFYDTLSCASSDVGTERTSMQLRTSTADGFRISVSSAAPSNSSAGSGQDDIESLGDLYVWGELWNDAVSDGYGPVYPSKNDVLTPKAIESNVVLDVQQIACGVRHIALVTRQGEVFTWGEESGGRLGHGTERDFTRPRLVEFLAVNNVDFVACGEYHTCAVSTSGDLFTWGDGTHNAGLLGHSTTVSHWIPKRVSGTLEGLQVLSIACGTWHSALSTSNGKLFTFGDGRFGVLGHGDRESYTYPKEVTTLNGLRTLKVACGVWHTAAIVEVMGQSGSTMTSRKLFTWGDGDKYRLGHGDKDTYLVPTCISTLIDYNFHQIACGHTLTVGLTTSGHVFSMGGTSYGQLGNPTSDGKNPCLVQENLVGEFVEVISCGAYHVAVLTARNEVFTWGRGSNGQLGHGDTEDRKIPTYVEALRDKNVKSISCGSNFTSSICIHKWVSGTDQSVCSGCRQAFGFTRKRHNCYHCGLVHCHSCSSKKALKAALAPTPGKPHRVCDNCYNKLKAAEAGSLANANRNTVEPRRSMDMREITSARLLLVPNMEPAKFLEITRNANYGSQSIARASPVPSQASQAPSNVQLKDVSFANSLHALQSPWKPAGLTAPPLPVPSPSSGNSSRSTSPYSRRPSPPPAPSPGFSRSVIESLKKTNDALKQDVTKMQNQIKSLKQKCDQQDTEIHKLQKQKKEAYASAAVESSKTKLAEEVFISIKNQLKEVEEQLPTNARGSEGFKSMNSQIEDFLSTRRAPLLPESVKSELYNDSGATSHTEDKPMEIHTHEVSYHDATNSPRHSNSSAAGTSTRKKEQMEQFEPGVYVTYVKLSNGEKLFKRVRFSKKRFQEQQAEVWWKANKERLFRRYLPSSPRSFSSAATGSSTSP